MRKPHITEFENRQLQRELVKEYGRAAQLDGILNLEEYNKSDCRILWILKEGNWGDDYRDHEEDHEGFSEEAINEKLRELLTDKYYENVTVYPNWRRTFLKISYATHGILKKNYVWDYISDIDHEAKIDGIYHLKDIAFINIKKVVGASSADLNEIYRSYQNHREFLHKQIEIINPDIIFNCNRVWGLFEYLADGNEIVRQPPFQYSVTPSRIILNIYHPAARIGYQRYFDLIMAIIQKTRSQFAF